MSGKVEDVNTAECKTELGSIKKNRSEEYDESGMFKVRGPDQLWRLRQHGPVKLVQDQGSAKRRSSGWGDAEGYATTSISVHLKLNDILELSPNQ